MDEFELDFASKILITVVCLLILLGIHWELIGYTKIHFMAFLAAASFLWSIFLIRIFLCFVKEYNDFINREACNTMECFPGLIAYEEAVKREKSCEKMWKYFWDVYHDIFFLPFLTLLGIFSFLFLSGYCVWTMIIQ